MITHNVKARLPEQGSNDFCKKRAHFTRYSFNNQIAKRCDFLSIYLYIHICRIRKHYRPIGISRFQCSTRQNLIIINKFVLQVFDTLVEIVIRNFLSDQRSGLENSPLQV